MQDLYNSHPICRSPNPHEKTRDLNSGPYYVCRLALSTQPYKVFCMVGWFEPAAYIVWPCVQIPRSLVRVGQYANGVGACTDTLTFGHNRDVKRKETKVDGEVYCFAPCPYHNP